MENLFEKYGLHTESSSKVVPPANDITKPVQTSKINDHLVPTGAKRTMDTTRVKGSVATTKLKTSVASAGVKRPVVVLTGVKRPMAPTRVKESVVTSDLNGPSAPTYVNRYVANTAINNSSAATNRIKKSMLNSGLNEPVTTSAITKHLENSGIRNSVPVSGAVGSMTTSGIKRSIPTDMGIVKPVKTSSVVKTVVTSEIVTLERAMDIVKAVRTSVDVKPLRTSVSSVRPVSITEAVKLNGTEPAGLSNIKPETPICDTSFGDGLPLKSMVYLKGTIIASVAKDLPLWVNCRVCKGVIMVPCYADEDLVIQLGQDHVYKYHMMKSKVRSASQVMHEHVFNLVPELYALRYKLPLPPAHDCFSPNNLTKNCCNLCGMEAVNQTNNEGNNEMIEHVIMRHIETAGHWSNEMLYQCFPVTAPSERLVRYSSA